MGANEPSTRPRAGHFPQKPTSHAPVALQNNFSVRKECLHRNRHHRNNLYRLGRVSHSTERAPTSPRPAHVRATSRKNQQLMLLYQRRTDSNLQINASILSGVPKLVCIDLKVSLAAPNGLCPALRPPPALTASCSQNGPMLLYQHRTASSLQTNERILSGVPKLVCVDKDRSSEHQLLPNAA